MTNRNRFDNVLSFQPADRLPNYELGAWPQTIDRWIAEGADDCWAGQYWFEGVPYFGLEYRAYAPLDIFMQPGFTPELLEETEDYEVVRHRNGIVTRALKAGTVRGGRMTMDQYLTHPVTDRASFQEIKKHYDPADPVRYPANWEALVSAWQARDYPLGLLHNGTFGLYSQLRSWVGTEEISYLFYDDPALVHEMVEFNTEFFLTLIEPALAVAEYDFFNFFEDFAGKGGPLISPQLFREFLLPSYQKVTERLRKAGVKHILMDSDGDPEVLLPLMMEAGVTCFWPLEQASGMDPVRLRKEYGHDLALAGGIDKIEIAKGRAAIDAELEYKIPALREDGGYLPFLDHTFSPEISYENFLYYLLRKAELCGHPEGIEIAQRLEEDRKAAV